MSVHEHDPNRPYWFERRTHSEHFEIHFLHFEAKTPNATWFEVPKECKNATDIEGNVISVTGVPEKLSPLVTIGNMKNDVCSIAVKTAVGIAKDDCVYTYGGNGPCNSNGGYDNDGIMAASFAHAGVFIPRLVAEQQENGSGCVGGIRPADLLFSGTPATHVAMVIGDNMIAECPVSGARCHITTLDLSRFDGSCRRYC